MEKQMNITQKSSPNQSSRNGYKPCLIVWHIADGTYNGTVAWEMNRDSQVSSHFVLGKGGEITQLVPLERAAWTQGVVKNPTHPYVKTHSGVNPNLYCVSIECEGVWSETKGALTDQQLSGRPLRPVQPGADPVHRGGSQADLQGGYPHRPRAHDRAL